MEKIKCPSCGSPNVERMDENRYECPYCGKNFAYEEGFTPTIAEMVHEEIESEVQPQQIEHSTKRQQSRKREYLWFTLISILTIAIISVVLYFVVLPKDTETIDEALYEKPQTVVNRSANGEMNKKDKQNTTDNNIPSFVGDGYTFDVKGHVKKIVYLESSDELWNLEFDSNGRLENIGLCEVVARNNKGQITEYYHDDGGGFRYKYDYNSDGTLYERHDWGQPELSDDVWQYEYDDIGNVKSLTRILKYECGNYVEIKNPHTFTFKWTIRVLSTDEYGNWLTRRIKGEYVDIEVTDDGFEYAGEDGPSEEKAFYVKSIKEFTERRKIEYY